MRAYYVLRQLSKYHEVHLLSFVRKEDSDWAIEHLAEFCTEVIPVEMKRSNGRNIKALASSFMSRLPFLITRDRVPEMENAIREVVRANSFDAIHADQLWMAQYALLAQKAAFQKGEHPQLVLDQHNSVYLIPERMAVEVRLPVSRWLLQREAKLMARYEVRTCSQFGNVVWVTQEDFEAVGRQATLQDVTRFSTQPRHTIIPICIDTHTARQAVPAAIKPVILFLGGMHWPPNAEGISWFIAEILPLIRAKIPDVTLLAVGKSPPRQIRDLEAVHTPGFVEDVEPYWQQSQVFIVPLRSAGGMRVKILDAWAHGLPVVSTTIGAEGLEISLERNILIADNPQEFARAVIRLLEDPGFRQHLAAGGKEQVARTYDWGQVYRLWDAIYPHGDDISAHAGTETKDPETIQQVN
jgi:glycosyltransferase involved in cell wall biosynthesis